MFIAESDRRQYLQLGRQGCACLRDSCRRTTPPCPAPVMLQFRRGTLCARGRQIRVSAHLRLSTLHALEGQRYQHDQCKTVLVHLLIPVTGGPAVAHALAWRKVLNRPIGFF